MQTRDHGGGIDNAIARFGGTRDDWIDLSTGINPVPYPIPSLPPDAWTALPDQAAFARLEAAARRFWAVPDEAAVLPATGASAIIAALPRVLAGKTVDIAKPTYNEHAAAFAAAGWQVVSRDADAQVVVHPNNPDGRIWQADDLHAGTVIIDESFCDVIPDRSLIGLAGRPRHLVLKSFGKFWGLAGLRLGFIIGDPTLIAALRDLLGPWQVSGPALAIGATALADEGWADATRSRLAADAARLDRIMQVHGATPIGGTSLFRLYSVTDAKALQDHLASRHIWTRIFPYSDNWIRLGLPAPDGWARLEAAL